MPSNIPNNIYLHENCKDGSKSVWKYEGPIIHKAKIKNEAVSLIMLLQHPLR